MQTNQTLIINFNQISHDDNEFSEKLVTEDQLRHAKGQELDRLASIMGYKRNGKLFKEDDFDFKYRLIDLNRKYLCDHPRKYRYKSFGNHLGSCGICGYIF